MDTRRLALAVLLALAAILLVDLPGAHLLDPDETRNAGVAREMRAAGSWTHLALNGTNYWDKPPLLYFAQVASFEVLGENPWAARLPVRIGALGTAAALAWALGGTAGLLAAALFLAAPLPFLLGRHDISDSVLGCALAVTMLLLRRWLLLHGTGAGLGWTAAGIGVASAAAVLAKGLVGIVLPWLALLAWAAILGRWRPVFSLLLSPALPVFLLVAAPWFVAMERAHPGHAWYFFWWEHFERFAGDRARNREGLLYVPGVFVVAFLPATAFLPAALRPLLLRSREELAERAEDLWFALSAGTVVLFFTFSKGKLPTYVLPAMAGAAALVGRHLAREGIATERPLRVLAVLWSVLAAGGIALVWRPEMRADVDVALPATLGLAGAALGMIAAWRAGRTAPARGAVVAAAAMAALYLGATAAMPTMAARRSRHDLAVAAAAAEASGARVVMFDCFAGSLPWVLRHAVPVVEYQGDLASDYVPKGKRARGVRPDVLWTRERFVAAWNSAERVVALVAADEIEELRSAVGAFHVVAGATEGKGRYALVANRP
jgi:4-amino-4-deoxy-L-arabinose transferase-like glycosyltransferase